VAEELVRNFPITRNSALAALSSSNLAERARGLETFSSAYWGPVYSYLRLRWRRSHEEAADLAQEFFADVVQKQLLTRFDAKRARFRTYLRVCIDGLVANHDKATSRQKRGGAATVHLGFEDVGDEIERLATESPETLFEKEWSRAVFSIALRRLRVCCEAAGKEQHYELLECYDLADERPTYAELSRRFGIATTDVTNRLSRVRRELRRVVLDVLRELTASEEEFREEARALLGARAP
jgi:RNA polymerase sigma factor (sigma-70 family)